MKDIFLLFIGLLLLFSCEYQDNGVTSINEEVTSQYLIDGMANGTLSLYLQGTQIFRYQGKPGIEIIPIGNADLSEYEPCFVLHIATGTTQTTIVTSAIIKLDDLEVLNTSDFSKNAGQFTYEVCNITPTSEITVEVRGEPGSYINIWIEGKPKCPCTVTDVDGNVYETAKIGDQCWMAENLKTTKYNDGTAIPLVKDVESWVQLTTPGYCFYLNDEAGYKASYGALYNWYTVDIASNGGKNVCPASWHVATDAEWTTLTDYLTNNGYGYQGSGNDIGKSMASTSGWIPYWEPGTVGNDQESNNSSSFTALPGGYRGMVGEFYFIEGFGLLWSATEFSTYLAWSWGMRYSSSNVFRSNLDKKNGFSVRCVRDK